MEYKTFRIVTSIIVVVAVAVLIFYLATNGQSLVTQMHT